jgi:hypothetical protein
MFRISFKLEEGSWELGEERFKNYNQNAELRTLNSNP